MEKSKTKISLLISVRIWLMLALQSITYLILIKRDNAFELSGFYWAIQLTLINLVLLVIMTKAFKKQGKSYFKSLFQFNKKNTILFLKLLLPIIIIAMLPNVLLSIVLYQDPQIGSTFLIGDIEKPFILLSVLVFPIIQALVELPFYFSYVMPMLKKRTISPWIYIGLPVIFLSLQHAFIPFHFDIKYVIYKSLMFFPFAILIGLLVHKKPQMLPYIMILHYLMNTSLFVMYFIK